MSMQFSNERECALKEVVIGPSYSILPSSSTLNQNNVPILSQNSSTAWHKDVQPFSSLQADWLLHNDGIRSYSDHSPVADLQRLIPLSLESVYATRSGLDRPTVARVPIEQLSSSRATVKSIPYQTSQESYLSASLPFTSWTTTPQHVSEPEVRYEENKKLVQPKPRDWNNIIRPYLDYHYRSEGLTLREVILKLREEHKFDVSKNMCKKRLASWDIRKNKRSSFKRRLVSCACAMADSTGTPTQQNDSPGSTASVDMSTPSTQVSIDTCFWNVDESYVMEQLIAEQEKTSKASIEGIPSPYYDNYAVNDWPS